MLLKTAMAVLSGGETATGVMDKVLGGVADVVKFSGTIVSYLVDNPIYLFLFATSFIGVGISVFSMLRSAASGH